MTHRAQVYVNGRPRPYFPGITVRFAIGPELAKAVERGERQVRDSRGYITGLDGSLAPGEALSVIANGGKGKHGFRDASNSAKKTPGSDELRAKCHRRSDS